MAGYLSWLEFGAINTEVLGSIPVQATESFPPYYPRWLYIKGFLGGASGKEPACQWRRLERHGFDSWVGKIPWRRKWQPTPVFLPGETHGERSLAGYSPWVWLSTHTHTHTEKWGNVLFIIATQSYILKTT